METFSLSAKKRDITGKQVKQLRSEGIVPAVVYGSGLESRSISVDDKVFEKVLSQAGESTLIGLEVEAEKPVNVLIQEVQRHPLSGKIVHIDFRQVNMMEKLETDIELKLVGESPAVKAYGGIMITPLNRVNVICLPTDLVHEIEVDISSLKNLGDNIKIGDLIPPKGIEFITEPDEIIVVVNEPNSEDEAQVTEVPADGVPVISKDEKKAE